MKTLILLITLVGLNAAMGADVAPLINTNDLPFISLFNRISALDQRNHDLANQLDAVRKDVSQLQTGMMALLTIGVAGLAYACFRTAKRVNIKPTGEPAWESTVPYSKGDVAKTESGPVVVTDAGKPAAKG